MGACIPGGAGLVALWVTVTALVSATLADLYERFGNKGVVGRIEGLCNGCGGGGVMLVKWCTLSGLGIALCGR